MGHSYFILINKAYIKIKYKIEHYQKCVIAKDEIRGQKEDTRLNFVSKQAKSGLYRL